MLILAMDSTAKAASVAVTDGERLLFNTVVDNGFTHSELLLPMAEDALKRIGRDFDDVELFACNVGPGSFTGVRIGVSLVKGLAFGHETPCAAVSTLHSLAYNLFPLEGIFLPVMDARRGQFYNAIFECRNGVLSRLTPDRAIDGAALAEELRQYENRPLYLVGDGYTPAKTALLGAGIAVMDTPELLLRQNAYSTARVAYALYGEGKTVDSAVLSPVYLRLPQAERERLEREGAL